MIEPRPLFEVRAAAPLLLAEGDRKAAAEAVIGWRESGLTVRVVRGRKMRTVESMSTSSRLRCSSRTTSARTGPLSTSASRTWSGCPRVKGS